MSNATPSTIIFDGALIEGYLPSRRTLLRWLFTRRSGLEFVRVNEHGAVDFRTPFRVSGPLTIQNCHIACAAGTTFAIYADRDERRRE